MTEHTEAQLVEVARERAEWLLDAVAMATQNRMFLTGEPEYDPVAGEAITANGQKAIAQAIKTATPLIQQQVLRDMYEWHRKHNRLPDIRHYAKEKLGIDL